MTNKRLQTDSTLKLNNLTEDQLADLELLSAYVDGEATQAESHQVQERLDIDPEFKRQYLHMHQIRQGLQAMPTPSTQSHRRLSNQVFRRLRWQKSKVISLWGGGAIAALFIAGVVSNIPRSNQTEFANRTEPAVSSTIQTASEVNPQEEALVVALNRPVLQIPKLATSEDSP